MFQFLANTQVGCRRSFPRHLLHRITTQAFLLAAAVIPQLFYMQGLRANQPTRPNIVLIMADDMGYGDLKTYNPESKIPTPHLDQLAHSGVYFTDAHSGGSTCKPSRYSLITGRFSARKENFNDRAGPIISADRTTVAEMLRQNGYWTAMVGKWHLGFDQKQQAKKLIQQGFAFDHSQPLSGGPVDRGFDSFFGMHASLDIPPYFYIRDRQATLPPTDQISHNDNVGGPEGWNNIQGAFWREGKISPDFKHEEVTPRFAAEASRVIAEHDGKKPLFLYLALPSPHTPWLPQKEFIGQSGAGMYGDFLMTVDHVVGKVMKSLADAGMSDSTLVMFSSDNGPVWYDKDVEKFGHRSVGPLKGIKASAWEGGHRVPFICRWPGVIQPGSVSKQTIAFADVFATFADIAKQGKIPKGVAEDSVSFLSALKNPKQRQQRAPLLHSEKVIRDGDWKLIATKGSRGFSADRKRQYGTELFHLKDDLSEERNLADQMPEKVEELKQKIQEILAKESHSQVNSDSDWQELFNGQDLNGWQANMKPESFTVENGLLKTHGKHGMSHLFYTGQDSEDERFTNFELVAVVRSEPNSNSGIFFHTDRELRKKKYLNKGYEVQLNSSLKEKRKTGSLYGVVNLASSPVDETEWFEVRVRVLNKRIQVSINDEQVIDYTEPDNPEREPSRAKRLIDPQGGAIALQAHDPNSIFYFKQIKVRRIHQPHSGS